jgi:hypothetical protein
MTGQWLQQSGQRVAAHLSSRVNKVLHDSCCLTGLLDRSICADEGTIGQAVWWDAHLLHLCDQILQKAQKDKDWRGVCTCNVPFDSLTEVSSKG